MDKQKFINMLIPGAKAAHAKYKLLPSVMMAQAILESGWGGNAPGFNLFGIKWTAGCGYDFQLLETKECYNEAQYKKLCASKEWHELIKKENGMYWVHIKAKFKKYKSYNDSITDHGKFLSTDRYLKVRSAKTYKEQANALKVCGYATDDKYPALLISIIESSNLQKYDK